MNAARNLLGIDLGTSGLKASVFDDSGTLLSQGYRASSYLPLPAGQKEQMPEQWWQGLCSATSEALAQARIGADSIAGIGVCGFHHCPVFLTEDGVAARPVMLLHDERLPASRQELVDENILGRIEEFTRSMVSAGHFPPILHYVRRHDPTGWEKTRWIVLAKDYLRLRLTGDIGTEICDATGTNLIEPGKTSWSERLCRLLSIPSERLPQIGSPNEIAGTVSDQGARQTGLRRGTPVVFGGGDSHCALLGLGCIHAGQTGLLLGTNSTLRVVFDKFVWHDQTKLWVQHHVVPSRYTLSASSMAGASVVGWFKQNMCQDLATLADNEIYRNLEETAAAVPIGSEGVIFLPYIYGERVPFYAPDASGGFLGLKHWHRRDHLIRSVFEGVALNIANCYDLIQECARAHGTALQPPRLGGGAGHATLWHQIIADCLGQPISVMNVKEAGTLGAALLAGIGVGIYSDYQQAVAAAVKEDYVIEPNQKNHAVYVELKETLNDCYRRLQ